MRGVTHQKVMIDQMVANCSGLRRANTHTHTHIHTYTHTYIHKHK